MSKNIDKYFHKQMNKEAGLEHSHHRTKIVATVGPACDTYEKLLELVRAGVNVFRLNFSHGSHEDKAKIIEHIRQINKAEPFNLPCPGGQRLDIDVKCFAPCRTCESRTLVRRQLAC